MSAATPILIVAINARYGHCSFAGRTLLAGLGRLQPQAALIETDLDVSPFQLAANILARRPRIVGFSVYLWNVRAVRETLAIIRIAAPDVRVVAGGPEIVPEEAAAWRGLADDLVAGEGETAFRRICEGHADGWRRAASGEPELTRAGPEDVATLALPYGLYTEDDLRRRTLYVESSRGCPFHCAFCTSSGTALRLLPAGRLLPALDSLLERGARSFRFLDRSFNAAEAHACEMLDFFLERHPGRLKLHFEIVPCRLSAALRARLSAFPPGTLHLEVGVQTLNHAVANRIGRAFEEAALLETLRFLTDAQAVVHVDLLFGLPGEDRASFAAGFDRLVRMFDPPELQVNLLKRLPGTPLAAATRQFGLHFNPHPPYELIRSDVLDFTDINRLQYFARAWELVHNRALCPEAARAVWQEGGGSPFERYSALADRIMAEEGRLHALGASCLRRHVAEFLSAECGLSLDSAARITGPK